MRWSDDIWRDGQFEFMVEVAPQEVASDAATAQRVEVLPFADEWPLRSATPVLWAQWRNTAEFIHGVGDSGPTQGESRR